MNDLSFCMNTRKQICFCNIIRDKVEKIWFKKTNLFCNLGGYIRLRNEKIGFNFSRHIHFYSLKMSAKSSSNIKLKGINLYTCCICANQFLNTYIYIHVYVYC